MKTVKQTAEYTVLQRGDGRYAVRGRDKKWINGEAKVDILVKEGMVKKAASKPKPEPEAGEAPKEEAAAEASPGADAEAQSGEES